jgi:hypothetical protein
LASGSSGAFFATVGFEVLKEAVLSPRWPGG